MSPDRLPQLSQGHYVVAPGGSAPPPPPPMPAPVAPSSVSSQQLNSFDPSSMDANAAHAELNAGLVCGRLGEQGGSAKFGMLNLPEFTKGTSFGYGGKFKYKCIPT